MQRRKLNVEARVGRKCRIRKRGCSSSSSSSLVHNYRLKRAVSVGKRGWSNTKYPPCKAVAASARGRATALWEFNEVSLPGVGESWEGNREMVVRSRGGVLKGLQSGCSTAQRLSEYRHGDYGRRSVILRLGGLEPSLQDSGIIKAETQSCGQTPSKCVVDVKTCLKDVRNGLTASKELVKVLNHICVQDERCSSGISLLSVLQSELGRARMHIDQLIQVQQSNRGERDCLLKQIAEEKASWKSRERNRIWNAISSIAEELEVERKLRRQTERLNKKLGRELADMKSSLSKTLKELQSEKRTKETIEQICDELAKGIGEDRNVEEMKKESGRAWDKVESESGMIPLADASHKERVQMKISEAKHKFKEKNAAVESDDGGYLRTELSKLKSDGSPSYDRIKELEEYLRKNLTPTCGNQERESDRGETVSRQELEGDDSASSDLHSIEFNVDNTGKGFNWSYTCRGVTHNDAVDEEINQRRTIKERVQKNRIDLEEKYTDGFGWNLGKKAEEYSDWIDKGRILEFASQVQRKDYKEEMERYKMVKDLRDHILFRTRKAAP
ncbi:uncharacterized protein At5g41620 [Diospyros lotus]|uniref:uncharacterized protein At5g41620 n=1 Tax=Diospyros lotus TaxID=55363 RepID=UPI00225B5376|nr:uncharacterized protein At5g41620 [Diospyros lotus]